jgi:hypothetical protein
MSTDGKPDLARGWRSAVKLRQQEADRLAEASDEDFEAAMAALPTPSRVPTIEEIIAAAPARPRAVPRSLPPAPIVHASPKPRRVHPAVGLLAAAFGALVVVGVVKRDPVVAFFKPAPAPHPVAPTPEEIAATAAAEAHARGQALRAQARDFINSGKWEDSRARLDEAKRIDPAGEADPDVRLMREAIVRGLEREDEVEAKIKPR